MPEIEIKTDRLLLRELTEDDSDFILKLLNQPSFLKFVGDKGVRTLDDARRHLTKGPIASYAEHGFGLYIVQLRADDTSIGMCGLLKRPTLDDPDFGFGFIPEFWSLGFATEAAQAVLDYATGVLGLERIVAITSKNNVSSIRVLERVGLQFERMISLAPNAPEIYLFSTSDAETKPSK